MRDGLAPVPEGRLLFGPLSVRYNLELGAYGAGRERRAVVQRGLERVHAPFPVLEERADQPAETLSGGEQQMLAVAPALMSCASTPRPAGPATRWCWGTRAATSTPGRR